MLDILEEFAPKETITIIVERRWKYRNPVKIVKQKFEIPVLVIRNTGKAVLVTKENGSSWADGKRGEALWIPSFAMDSVGDRKYKIRYNKIDSDDFIKFIKRFGYKPKEEIEESLVMKGFTEFLEEREVIMTHEIEKARLNVYEFFYAFGTDNWNDSLMYEIQDGVKDVVKKVFSQVEDDIEVLIKNNVFPKLVRKYNLLYDAYLSKEKEIQTILTCVRIGEKQETAIKKISKMTKTLKYFNLEQMKVTTNYFDPMSEKDILKEIEDFNGQVKLRGAMDFYIEFKNGKVFKTYF